MKKFETLLCTIALFVMSAVFVFFAVDAMNTPEVIFSWSTKKCVKVQFMDGSVGSCDHLPEKYDYIWSK